MRNKLQKFTDFANGLLPHETEYLLSVQQFQDKKKLDILEQIDFNCKNIHLFKPFDEEVDKRKYSNLKTWIEEHLAEIDVDAQYDWIARTNQSIMTDSITPEEEKNLLKTIKDYPLSTAFYFIKFYELVKDYRQFLLIRMRYAEHRQADNFLKDNKERYDYCSAVSEKMHEATLDIVHQYSQHDVEPPHDWESWLTNCFYDEKLDGLNRYLALVRLTFLYNNYRKFEKLLVNYDAIDALFRKGIYYSKRLLVNYYGNRLLLHTRFNEFDKAEYYGYLSTRVKNNDYLHYINNLCSILLRGRKNEAALKLMRQAHPEMKRTQSFHNKIGFMGFYTKALNVNGLCRNGESYVESFLRVYKNEVFEHRWHLFFTAYLESLLGQKKYVKLLQIVKRFKLLDRERQYRKNAAYLPTVLLYNALAEFKDEKITFKDLNKVFQQEKTAFADRKDRQQQFLDVAKTIGEHLTDGERSRLNI
ncbi:MAG: hypothetical protein JNL70_28445 [Saprospiraceae bacterium]|nr:hypothetical protein [Saprospiraceae bacterium]